MCRTAILSQAAGFFNPIFSRFATSATAYLSKILLKTYPAKLPSPLFTAVRKNSFSKASQKCPNAKGKTASLKNPFLQRAKFHEENFLTVENLSPFRNFKMDTIPDLLRSVRFVERPQDLLNGSKTYLFQGQLLVEDRESFQLFHRPQNLLTYQNKARRSSTIATQPCFLLIPASVLPLVEILELLVLL